MIYLKALPYLIAVIVGIGIGTSGTLTIAKMIKPKIEVPPCPACNCPEQKPCNGIDFDKIKSRNLAVHVDQHLTLNGDSTLLKRFIEELQKSNADLKQEMKNLKLSKCK
jgi:hypothetical protein